MKYLVRALQWNRPVQMPSPWCDMPYQHRYGLEREPLMACVPTVTTESNPHVTRLCLYEGNILWDAILVPTRDVDPNYLDVIYEVIA